MYPFHDPEGQLEAWRYISERLEEEGNSSWSFAMTLVASVLAAAVTPTLIWLFLGLG